MEHGTRNVRDAGLPGMRPATLWLVLAMAYAVFAFLLTPNRPFPFYPDDFSFLAGTLDDMGWNWKRPVSANIIFLTGASGQVASYIVLAASTVTVAWLVLLFLRQVFGVGVRLLPAMLFGVVLFSHAGAFEHGKYLGLMTNLVSHGFGLLSLLLLWRGWHEGRYVQCLVAGLFYLASAFAKEDFLLPPLLLVALLWALDQGRASGDGRPLPQPPRRGRLAVTLLFFAVATGSLAWSAYDRNPFVAGLFSPETSNASYAVELAPAALLAALGKLFIGYTGVATAISAAACGAMWFIPGMRLRLLWFMATVVALALPYAVIPHNMPGYRAYAWLPWMAAVIAIGLSWWQSTWATASWPRRSLPILVALATVLVSTAAHREARIDLALHYAAGEAVNRRMLEALETSRPAIASAPAVGLLGLDGPSPWCGNGTLYLHRKRGFEQRWVVFAPGPTPCYQTAAEGARKPRYDLRLSVAAPHEACSMGALPVLAFERDGSGRLVTAQDVCAGGGSVH